MKLIDAEPIEKKLLPLADKALAKNPYEKARICAYRRAFEMVLDAPTITLPSNDPLTLEELRKMDGEPVWVVSLGGQNGSCWMLVDAEYELCRETHGGMAVFENNGKTWLAYRRKPEEEAK